VREAAEHNAAMPSRHAIDAATAGAIAEPPTAAVRYLDRLARAIALIDADLSAPLDSTTLAAAAAMSRHHFQRLFHAYVGTTVQGYLTWRRLRRACELLAGDDQSVLDVALAVGYDSAQSLAKAMRRELDTTPTAVRLGQTPQWQMLYDRRLTATDLSRLTTIEGATMLQPRWADVPAVPMLTATAHGMNDSTMTRAARQAFGELMAAVSTVPRPPQPVYTCLALCPDEPDGPNDPKPRYVAALVFGQDITTGEGQARQPDLPLNGTLAWDTLSPGRYAVFRHRGPYDTLYRTWETLYRDWLPATGHALRDVPPFEVTINDPTTTAPADLLTDIYLPVV